MAQPPPGAQQAMPPPGFPQLSPQQIQEAQQRFLQEAARQGITPQELAQKIQAQAREHQARMMAQAGQGGPGQQPGQPGPQTAPNQQQQGQGQGQAPPRPPPQMMQQQPQQMQPQQPGPPKPEAIAVANFLQSQNLKMRPCVLQEKRRELFKVKRAIRALQSPAYEKARAKNPLLPPVTDRVSAENVFKLLPLSMLALRVAKFDPANNPAHGEPGHRHGQSKGKKGIWQVQIVQQQDAADYSYYVWFYQGSQWRQKLYAVGALIAVVAVVLFPLWPYTLRRGVWYLSMGALGLLAAFFGLAIVRLILFLLTIVAVPPGIWLYPNLFEDVGFFDSFRPIWAWRETPESLAALKKAKKAKKLAKKEKKAGGAAGPKADRRAASSATVPVPVPVPTATAAAVADEKAKEAEGAATASPQKIVSQLGATGAKAGEKDAIAVRRNLNARVEEIEDDDSDDDDERKE